MAKPYVSSATKDSGGSAGRAEYRRQVGGEKSVMFRDSAVAKETLAKLKRAQAEAEIRCF